MSTYLGICVQQDHKSKGIPKEELGLLQLEWIHLQQTCVHGSGGRAKNKRKEWRGGDGVPAVGRC